MVDRNREVGQPTPAIPSRRVGVDPRRARSPRVEIAADDDDLFAERSRRDLRAGQRNRRGSPPSRRLGARRTSETEEQGKGDEAAPHPPNRTRRVAYLPPAKPGGSMRRERTEKGGTTRLRHTGRSLEVWKSPPEGEGSTRTASVHCIGSGRFDLNPSIEGRLPRRGPAPTMPPCLRGLRLFR
jgi:hypothetical protein